jgi:hypothetical protein
MAKIKLRRDTASNWTTENPVLAPGEPGFETDTRKIKYGDGNNAWNNLDYVIPSFTIGAEETASGDGAIAYDDSTAVLTYTPPDLSTYITLSDISVGAETIASNDGGISYDNTTGVFTYTPPTALGIGAIALSSLSVGAEAAASGDGGIAFNSGTGVFTYTPPLDITGNAATATTLSGLTASIAELNYNDITTIGTVEANKTVTADALSIVRFGDNSKIRFGTDDDLEIYHDGSHSFITDLSTGNLIISSSQIDLLGGPDGAEIMATFVDNGAVTLYYDNSSKLATTISGASVAGNLVVNGSEDLADTAAASLVLHASYFTTAGAETATLAAGTEGQIKTFMMAGYVGNMVITVTNPGWGGAGTITFSAAGHGCTLQYVNSKWFCIGNNGAAFA